MLSLIGLLLFVGVILWAINYAPFIDGNIKSIVYIIIVLTTMVYVLNQYGIMPKF